MPLSASRLPACRARMSLTPTHLHMMHSVRVWNHRSYIILTSDRIGKPGVLRQLRPQRVLPRPSRSLAVEVRDAGCSDSGARDWQQQHRVHWGMFTCMLLLFHVTCLSCFELLFHRCLARWWAWLQWPVEPSACAAHTFSSFGSIPLVA